MNDRMVQMRRLLESSLNPIECDLQDDSEMHRGHAGARGGAGHYSLAIVSSAFEGRSRIARHRMVYDCLRSMMPANVHALSITALAPSERC